MKRQLTQILVSEIHPANLLLFWLLSFFMKVEAYRVHPTCPRILCRRFEMMDLGQHLSWNDTHCFRSKVMQLWEGLLEKFPRNCWAFGYHDQLLDFSTKAKQDLAHHFERLMLLQEVRRRREPASRIYIIDSPQFRYLKRLDPSADFFNCPACPTISQINVSLDLLFMYLSNLAHMSLLLLTMLYGCIHKDRHGLRHTGGVPYIWDAVNSNELTLDPDRRTFHWIVDSKHIAPQDVLFVLPRNADRKARPDLRSSGHQAFTILELYRLIPVRILLWCLRDLLVFISRYMVPAPRGLASIQKAHYFATIMRIKPVVQHFRPISYITSISRMGNEDPATVYLNSIGVKTVMYSYSASAANFGSGRCDCDFRAVDSANFLAHHLVVWNKDFQEFIQQHPQEKVEIEVIGPLMPGDESVMHLPRPHLRKQFIPQMKSRDSLRYISVFDVAPRNRKWVLANQIYPSWCTEYYYMAFLRDILRLLEDFDNIALIFKPKRSLASPYHSFGTEGVRLLDKLDQGGRGFVADDDINPWVPIAMADLCLGLPFMSPVLAGMHYGTPGLFHDPTGIALSHRYESISHLITHDYDQLKSKVRSILFDGSCCQSEKEAIWSEARDFIGARPGTNSSDRFEAFLRGGHIWERGNWDT